MGRCFRGGKWADLKLGVEVVGVLGLGVFRG